MKKLLVILTLIVLPVLANARQWQIGMNVGLVKNTPAAGMDNSIYGSGGFAPTATFKVLRNINKNWQAGISVGLVPLSYMAKFKPLYFTDNFAPQDDPVIYYDGYLANPAIPVQVEVNHTFRLSVFDLYAGMSAGAFVTPDVMFTRYLATDYETAYNPVSFVGGMQAGGSWFFVPWCGLNVQAAMSYYHSYRVIAVPVTAGIRFRF